MTYAKTMTAVAAAAATLMGAVTLPAAANTNGQHYTAAQRQAYAAGYRRGFYRGHVAAAYGASGGVQTGRSAAVGGYPAQPGAYNGPFANGGALGTGLFNGNGVLGTGVFDGQGALGLGVLGF